MVEPNEGTKHDQGKLRLDLIPPEAEEALAEILSYGARKYDDRNWEKGIKYSRIYAALRRHLLAWTKGEMLDKESGLPHLNHAFCCLMFLVTYETRNMNKWDDLTAPQTWGIMQHDIGGTTKEFPVHSGITVTTNKEEIQNFIRDYYAHKEYVDKT